MPSISIIVPLFNGIRYLPYFLESLAAAILPNTEVIFVDDGSSERVLEAIPDSFPADSIIKLQNEQNWGYSSTVNRGFACARGDILIQLNTDMVLDRRCIEAMVKLIDSTPGVGIVGSKQLSPTTGLLRHIGMAFGEYSRQHIYAGLPGDHPLCCKTRKMQIVSGATAAMAKQVLGAIGPLEERYYNTLENCDHCLKALAHGYVNYACAESVAYHWVSQSGPARFARKDEGEAIFWGDWGSTRSVDLDNFVEEALDHALTSHPELSSCNFEPLSLCRSSDESILRSCVERRWRGAESRTHHTSCFNSPHNKLWLPMELPQRAITNPSPYVYLVDQISQLSENRLWFETRHRFAETELVIDTRAAAVTTCELLAMYGEPL